MEHDDRPRWAPVLSSDGKDLRDLESFKKLFAQVGAPGERPPLARRAGTTPPGIRDWRNDMLIAMDRR